MPEVKVTAPVYDEKYPGQLNDERRAAIIEKCVDVVSNMIDDSSDGTLEEEHYLTAAITLRLLCRVRCGAEYFVLRREPGRRVER